jgi:MFS family permease
MTSMQTTHGAIQLDSPRSWARLALAVTLNAIGGVGMWSVVVALPAVQADFGVARADASFPYTLALVSFAFGGVAMGRLADLRGVPFAVTLGAVIVSLGYVLSALTHNFLIFALCQGVLVGVGCSATFGPLIADISHWFERRRGLAVAICAAGNYLGGVIWPPVVQHFIETSGWRATHIGIGLLCLVAMPAIAAMMRRGSQAQTATQGSGATSAALFDAGLSPRTLQILLVVAGLACCVAMSMPQVHIVAYCADLGYGPARGADMLSLMLGFGIVSRIASGFVADKIGGVATLLIGSLLQGVALLLYMFFDGLIALYVISALFGLFQGGIIPSYAIIVREYFAPREAGARVGLVLMATLFGMALGGWLSGIVFDLTGGYRAAFANGLAWNLLNVSIMSFLMFRGTRRAVAVKG